MSNTDNSQQTIIPVTSINEAIFLDNIGKTEKLFLLGMANLCITLNELSEMIGLSPTTRKKVIKSLIAKEWIRKTKTTYSENGDVNHYLLTLPSHFNLVFKKDC